MSPMSTIFFPQHAALIPQDLHSLGLTVGHIRHVKHAHHHVLQGVVYGKGFHAPQDWHVQAPSMCAPCKLATFQQSLHTSQAVTRFVPSALHAALCTVSAWPCEAVGQTSLQYRRSTSHFFEPKDYSAAGSSWPNKTLPLPRPSRYLEGVEEEGVVGLVAVLGWPVRM